MEEIILDEVETTETEPTIELNADASETATEPQATAQNVTDGSAVCSTCQIAKDAASEFSILQNGKRSPVCKRCRADAANEWTTSRADYRKDYHLGLRLQNMGYPVILPNAKDWKAGDVLVLTDGRDAREVYAADKASRRAKRDAERATQTAEAERIKAERKAQRDAERQARLEAAGEQAAVRLEEREARKAAKAEERRLKAEEAAQNKEQRKTEKAAERALKAQERAEAAAVKSAERAAEREQKARERAEAAATKAAEREQERAEKARLKAEAAAQAAAEKAAKAATASQTVQPSVATVAETVETGAVEETESGFSGGSTLSKLQEMFGN
jgi:hypothetical protein